MSESHGFPPDAKLPLEEITSARRHLFLCVGPDCCSPAEGDVVWSALKAETRKLSVPVLRTKAACLRICKAGPWLVVYPDGIWYGQVDADKLRRILKEHIEEGRPVREWIAADMPNLCARSKEQAQEETAKHCSLGPDKPLRGSA
jgi:(2Fe-2S) ferredoxin